METQAAFAERWTAEFYLKKARTANWLLNQPELLPQTNQETLPLWQANITEKGIRLVEDSKVNYLEMEINWSHPCMREALRIYYADNLRFDGTVNLNQKEPPGDVDVNPDYWLEVSQILRQLRYRDVSANFGLSKYCPQFSSMYLDNVTSPYCHGYVGLHIVKEISPNCPSYQGARGHIARTPALLYQELAAQYGTEEEHMHANTIGFDRVISPHLNRPPALNYHEFAKNIFPKSLCLSPAEPFPDLGVQYSIDENNQLSNRNGPRIDRVVSSRLKKSQAATYHEYAKSMFQTSMNESPAETYRDFALEYSKEEDCQLPRKHDKDKANPLSGKDIRRVGSVTREPDTNCAINNPLHRSLISVTRSVSFGSPRIINYTQTNGEKVWKRIPYTMKFVQIRGKMIRDISLKEIQREYTGHVDGACRSSSSTTVTLGSRSACTDVHRAVMTHEDEAKCHIGVDGLTPIKPLEHSANSLCKVQNNVDNNPKKTQGSLYSDESLNEAIRQILSEEELPKHGGKMRMSEHKMNPPKGDECIHGTNKSKGRVALLTTPREEYVKTRGNDADVKNTQEQMPKECLDKSNAKTKEIIQAGITELTNMEIRLLEDEAATLRGTQNQVLEEYLSSTERKITEVNQAQGVSATNLQTQLGVTEEQVSEQSGTSRQSSSTSVWSANQFNLAVLKQKEKHRIIVSNDNIDPTSHPQNDNTKTFKPLPKVQRGLAERGSHPGEDIQVGHDSHTRVRDTKHHVDTISNEDSVQSEYTDSPYPKKTYREEKPKQRNTFFRFIRRQASHIRNKMKSFCCRARS